MDSRRSKNKEKPSDFDLDYGDAEGIAGLLKLIARKEGIGAVLAEGIRFTAKEWGQEDIAVHVKGMEPAGYDPRSLKGMGLAYATSDRGACHLRATFYKPELAGMIPPDQIEGKARMFLDFEDRLAIMDTLEAAWNTGMGCSVLNQKSLSVIDTPSRIRKPNLRK